MERKTWLSHLATANSEQLAQLFDHGLRADQYRTLREPEVGTVMARARMGGTGDSFNCGEITVTRCSVELNGVHGHGYVQGRNKQQALTTALMDAIVQTDQHEHLIKQMNEPIAAARAARLDEINSKSEATRVDFFTRVRGED